MLSALPPDPFLSPSIPHFPPSPGQPAKKDIYEGRLYFWCCPPEDTVAAPPQYALGDMGVSGMSVSVISEEVPCGGAVHVIMCHREEARLARQGGGRAGQIGS